MTHGNSRRAQKGQPVTTASAIAIPLNAGRIAYGLAAVVAPSRAARGWIGRAAKQPDVVPMIRAFGIRDVALGAATIGTIKATGPGGVGARVLLGLGVMVDVVDTASGFSSRRDVPSASMIYAIAGGAAIAGAAALAAASASSQDDEPFGD